MTGSAARYANTRVLIVDDQPEIHDDFTEMLRPQHVPMAEVSELGAAFAAPSDVEPEPFLPSFELLHASTGEEVYDIIRRGQEWEQPVAVAYIDIRMPPGIDGIETIRRVRRIDRDVEIVIKLLYIRKPFVHEEIQQLTLCLVGKWNVERELAHRQRELAGSDRRLEAVLDATGDALAMLGDAGHVVFANAAYEKLLDLPAGELRGLVPEALAARFEERFRELDPSDVESGFLLYRGVGAGTGDPRRLSEQRLFSRTSVPEAEQMKAEVLRLRSTLETTFSVAGMVGTSPGMRQVYALIKQAAEGDITVLIRGESGTGKELVARSFHGNSPRQDGPFVTLDCTSIPESLIENELFGHERGAFTGATTRHVGAFERASGGTILLDEIGDMPVALQARLLRGSTAIPVDIRVITATNKDLESAVAAGEFREDLFYRIAVFPIVIPPLRDRREDIPLLARHFLEKHAARAGKAAGGISTAAMRILLQYDWPGNVRELENSIQRAVLLETGPVLQAGSLPPTLSANSSARGAPAAPEAVLTLAEVERRALVRVLEVADGNITQAARALGISRATLYRKLRKYDLSPQGTRPAC